MNEFSTTKEIMAEFAQRIKKERLKQNITQEDMALRSGISLSTYKLFEKNGKGTFENFINITKALGKSSQLNTLLVHNSFSPKEMVLSKKEKKSTRQRASSKGKHSLENEIEKELIKPTRIGNLLNKIKVKNETK